MKEKKTKIEFVLLVVFAWLIALSLIYLVLMKIRFFTS
jgi:hypothetical protein